MGYSQAQTLRAIREAESYDGPSIVICYCPCLEHGIRAGMGTTQLEMKKAVECGYWHLYRFDPRLAAQARTRSSLILRNRIQIRSWITSTVKTVTEDLRSTSLNVPMHCIRRKSRILKIVTNTMPRWQAENNIPAFRKKKDSGHGL